MKTFFVRHSRDINTATYDRLWTERRVAIHYPWESGIEDLEQSDTASLDWQAYADPKAKGAVRALVELARDGGYVCAEYPEPCGVLIGRVAPGTGVDILEGRWGDGNGLGGRTAVLKSVRLSDARELAQRYLPIVLAARPRQGTFQRWKACGDLIQAFVEGSTLERRVGLLTTAQQEVLCSEFLRSDLAEAHGLQRVASLLLPVGRTLRDVDIVGLATDGSQVFAQVTYKSGSGDKRAALLRHHGDGVQLVMFSSDPPGPSADGVVVVPLETVFAAVANVPWGAAWIGASLGP